MSDASARPVPPHEATRNVPPVGSQEPSLGELVSSLSDDFTTLMRKEFELAAAEMQANVKEAVRAGTMLGVAGFLGYAGLILLLIAASLWLGTLLESMWLGTGIVGLIVVVIAGILYASGKSKLDDVNLAPRKAIKSVERDMDMAKEKLS
ncbi:MAG: phage holin family protein [Litorilinea sp.]